MVTKKQKKKSTPSEIRRAEELDNSRPFDVHKWSDYPEVNDAVNYLHPKVKKYLKSKSKRGDEVTKRHIKVAILDLWATRLQDPKRYIAYSQSPNNYDAGSRYNECFVSKKNIDVMKSLFDLKYVSFVNGYFKRPIQKGKYSRVRALKKLEDLIVEKSGCIPEMIDNKPERECIILRKKNKKPAEYGEGTDIEEIPEVKIWRRNLCDYNNLLRCTHIDIPGFPEKGVPVKMKNPYTKKGKKKKQKMLRIDHTNKFVERIFNNESWDDGGRYYGGWWQSVPNDEKKGKKWRTDIRVDGWPTIEMDYSALHIILCYALEGYDYYKECGEDADPYYIPEYNHIKGIRSFLKEVLLTILNCKTEKEACQVIVFMLRDVQDNEHYWVKESLGWKDLKHDRIKILIDNLKKQHPKIDGFFHKAKGVKLQNTDSRVAEIVIREFVLENRPILCLHDSFIVKRLDYQELLYQMKNAYLTILNENSGSSKKIIKKPPLIKYANKTDNDRPVIYWFGIGHAIKDRESNKKAFEDINKPLKKKHYRIRRIRFEQTKANRDKNYYRPKK
jgi:hypothetical protein